MAMNLLYARGSYFLSSCFVVAENLPAVYVSS